jgi:c-di-GMP-binding flagellar brake protein YcgR
MGAMSAAETRRFARRRVELTARLACLDAERDPRTGLASYRVMVVRTVDISDGGLCIRAEEPVNCGRLVVLELDLPDGRTCDVSGRIVWLEPREADTALSRMGVEFSQLSAGLLHALS